MKRENLREAITPVKTNSAGEIGMHAMDRDPATKRMHVMWIAVAATFLVAASWPGASFAFGFQQNSHIDAVITGTFECEDGGSELNVEISGTAAFGGPLSAENQGGPVTCSSKLDWVESALGSYPGCSFIRSGDELISFTCAGSVHSLLNVSEDLIEEVLTAFNA